MFFSVGFVVASLSSSTSRNCNILQTKNSKPFWEISKKVLPMVSALVGLISSSLGKSQKDHLRCLLLEGNVPGSSWAPKWGIFCTYLGCLGLTSAFLFLSLSLASSRLQQQHTQCTERRCAKKHVSRPLQRSKLPTCSRAVQRSNKARRTLVAKRTTLA